MYRFPLLCCHLVVTERYTGSENKTAQIHSDELIKSHNKRGKNTQESLTCGEKSALLRRLEVLTCLIGMALPLPMLSVLLSTLFACSLAFRDCKKTRKSVNNWSDTHMTRQSGSWAVGRGVWMVLCSVCWGVCGWVHECVEVQEQESGGQEWGVLMCAFVCGELDVCKLKFSKEAQKEQTSRPAEHTAVTLTCKFQKEKKKKKYKRDQTKTTLDTFQHRGDQGRPHIESWLSPETLWRRGSFSLWPRVGPEWTCRPTAATNSFITSLSKPQLH